MSIQKAVLCSPLGCRVAVCGEIHSTHMAFARYNHHSHRKNFESSMVSAALCQVQHMRAAEVGHAFEV
jgi:hypothetical protein